MVSFNRIEIARYYFYTIIGRVIHEVMYGGQLRTGYSAGREAGRIQGSSNRGYSLIHPC